ncbi:hypothetical protein SADUNF_Sadunf08G0153200 [Salix dunnii]|uniref:Nucleotide-diphospho-sugar transferase domain-containing protein n=1 Tax=Salix dunnii TaxID=1413687 RepID=A0A835K0J6_9ROSI|nr:hypothetical protein SADUNF_Sadunf08G0153200 [Salix dunnii]
MLTNLTVIGLASLRNVSYFPFHLDETEEHCQREDGRSQQLQEILGHHWNWNHCEDIMLMAWNNRNLSLHNGVLPPFLYGKGIHNHWVINEVVSSELRLVFDASWTISCPSLNYHEHWSKLSVRGSSVLEIKNRSWEEGGNSHLGALYSSKFFQPLLSITADENKTLVLAVAGYSYMDMLMSWVCRLHQLQVTNFIICALDQETYQFRLSEPVNLPRRLNSGSYFDRSDGSSVAAMEKVVKHAARSNLSEQPSFYDTMCGEGGSYCASDNRCVEPETNLTLLFLERNLFPNGLNESTETKSRRKRELEGAPIAVGLCIQWRDISVRIVHPGGREELYRHALPASWLMEKYSGTCIARPGVFKNPKESLLRPDENLLPSHKYLLIPSTTVRKLTLKHMGMVKVKGFAAGKDEITDANITWDESGDISEESVGSAKEFYASKDTWPRYKVRRAVKVKKPFVPPLPMARSLRVSVWEPSLTSVQEVSP